MDWKKCLEAAKIPTIALVLLGILNLVINLTFPTTEATFGWAVLLLDIPILAYVGYSAVKTYKLALGGAALSGLLAGIISTAVIGVIAMAVFFVFGAEAFITLEKFPVPLSPPITLILFGVLVACILNLMIIGGIMGAIMGAIGGFIAKKTMR